MSPLDRTHTIINDAEDDVRTVPELLIAIKTLVDLAHTNDRGLTSDECRGLCRLAGHAFDSATRVETMWDEAFRASGGRTS